jgi:parallel beta-helix repeat protein
VKRWLLLVVVLLMLPALACSFSVDLGEEGAESTEPAPRETAGVPTQPPKEEPASPLLPTPSLPVSVSVSVAADGSGDYPTLVAAVDAVPAGSTIVLGAGTYRLAEPLEINKSLRLKGAGMDQTFVVGEAERHVLRFQGPGTFAVEDITFRYEATNPACVVAVEDGDVEFKRCLFSGAVRGEEEGNGGVGLFLLGDTVGSIEACRMEENALHGIQVSDQAAPVLEGNVCSENGESGIAYFDESGGLARQNRCTRNGLHGIGVKDEARPTLEENVCSENEQAGIAYLEEAGGLARHNECTGNVLHGIGVSMQATPTLEGNICSENEQSGIVYFEEAGGLARQNECTANGLHGIAVQGRAAPTLEENVCRDNARCGIAFLQNGGGVARRNECSANEYGICIGEEANPQLVDNYWHDNQQDIRDDRS